MTGPQALHLTDTPLTKGTSLIEASAGTGKTYAITALFIRLILQENLSVREILVVTYTKAATEELRHRIRQTRGIRVHIRGDLIDGKLAKGQLI